VSLFSRLRLNDLQDEVKQGLSGDLKQELDGVDKSWRIHRLTSSHSADLDLLYVTEILYAVLSATGGNHVVAWLNSNQGFVIAILTLVYVVATLFIAIVMLRSNSISSRSLAQALEQERLLLAHTCCLILNPDTALFMRFSRISVKPQRTPSGFQQLQN
jgi:hypothetical protein